MRIKITILSLILLSLSACKNSSSGGAPGESNNGSIGTPGTRQFSSSCGVVNNGTQQNPVSEQSGIVVDLKSVVSPNTVIISRAEGDQLIKLVGVSDSQGGYTELRGQALLEQSIGRAILYYADPTCQVTVVGGGAGTYGTIVRDSDGINLNEALIEQANANAESGLACGTGSVRNCYIALDQETELETGAIITNFLWKPVGDHSSQLVVLLNPLAASVLANGEQLVFTGASNGRATTARGNRQGCAYGANVRVEAFDTRGRVLVFPNGELSVTIPNGCSRVEF